MQPTERSLLIGLAQGFVIGAISTVLLISWDESHRPLPPPVHFDLDPGTTVYTQPVSGSTLVNIPESVHGEGQKSRDFCFDNSSPERQVNCAYTVTPDGTVIFYFSPPFTGRIVIAPRLKSQRE